MISKQHLIDLLKKEFATTIKVMEAYPAEKLHFAPHERSSTTKKLLSTFVFEMYLMASHILGDVVDAATFKAYDPADLHALINDFKSESEKVIAGLKAMSDEDLDKTVTFAGRGFAADEFVMMMLHDQIHHRGQLSVYVRMAGGLVPSIYGPSADDTGTNL